MTSAPNCHDATGCTQPPANGGDTRHATPTEAPSDPPWVMFPSPKTVGKKAGTSARGYGTLHQQFRKRFEPLVASGRAVCARCGLPIVAGSEWDLGHDDKDRSKYAGPEHPRCNRGAPRRRRPVKTLVASREW